jgi:hypothetical protein
MNLQNEHSLRFLLPASEYGTDQGVTETPASRFKLARLA